MSEIVLTRGQETAIKLIKEWYYSNKSQVFSLSGCAGTGKSTVIARVAEELGLGYRAVYATLTGKAAVVLNTKGVPAVTIHRLIYDRDPNTNKLSFHKKPFLDTDYKLIIIDEYSMVDKKIHQDLLSFGVKVLVVGDPGQLPPIGEEVGLLSAPDFLLTEIVRQAKDSPIIRLSQMVLAGGELRPGSIGKQVFLCKKEEIPDRVYLKADQILCGTNNTRREINEKVRALLKRKDLLPVSGEKLICTRNNWGALVDNIPIINGTLGICNSSKRTAEPYFILDFTPDYSSNNIVMRADTAPFYQRTPQDDLDQFDFGYAITVHKAQGSEFDNVLLIKDRMPKQTYRRWLYTGITRAKKGLIIAL